MSIRDKPGRQISLSVISDHERGIVQIIRNLHNTKGFLVDSGNMGWMPIAEFDQFISDHAIATKPNPRLIDIYGAGNQ